MELNDKRRIESAFRATGIIPLNPTEVIKRLPEQRAEQHKVSENINESLLSFLKDTRAPSTSSGGIKPRKKMLKIAPGKSVSHEDFLVKENEEKDESSDEEEFEQTENIVKDINDEHDEEIVVPAVGLFAIIKFCTKKTVKHYIARIEDVDSAEGEVTLKYLRYKHGNLFCYPQEDDISRQSEDDIVCILKPPTERRGIFTFKVDINKFHF